ncbi:hypothetical protein QCB44_06875 [Thiomicrorhabdus sp. zzn3]|uniref:hypothetical protein n=1 Tax=Thiomicrorhabdus sp. zzn3 TaxID=3039775 RepID=UPI00243719B9|nr:hypothetical protein [Thiomicrorhabdus sp. zzn3]MDG6778421.1 hypothetical protein [Thiomicrorhabdus sp. zzn3]
MAFDAMLLFMSMEFIYQCLSGIQRARFPQLSEVERMPVRYEDSTNQLWQAKCVLPDQGEEVEAVLKLCSQSVLDQSPFWMGMSQLFGLKFALQMGRYAEVYRLLEQWGGLPVPRLLSAAGAQTESCGWLLAEKVEGGAVAEVVGLVEVSMLAQHLGLLHQQRSRHFGPLFEPTVEADDWGRKVVATIQELAESLKVDVQAYAKPLHSFEQAWSNRPAEFVPIMPDLRWDQFLRHAHQLVLVDVDAMVWGARELEWVMLEYLLDEQQAQLFKQEYEILASVPVIGEDRTVYRLLLFLMNVLGESSLEAWMNAPTRFD